MQPVAIILLVCLTTGCASTAKTNNNHIQAKQLRAEARTLSIKGWNGLAIRKIKASINKAQQSGLLSHTLIEGYDDAGLYYYNIGDYKNSARYQSIAVLLAYSRNQDDPTIKIYSQRLNWALKKYAPTFNTDEIKNPTVLICKQASGNQHPNLKQLALNKNSDIKKYYYRARYRHPKTHRKKWTIKQGICA